MTAPASSALLKSALLMIASCLFFTLMSAGARYLSAAEGVPANYVIFLRNLLSTAFIVPFALLYRERVFATPRKKPLIWRAVIGMGGMLCWYNALAVGSLAQVTALSFAAPLLTTLAAILFLGERVSRRRWSALAAGFTGMLIIIGPGVFTGMTAEEAGSLWALGTAACWALVALLLKSLADTEPLPVILLYMMGVMLLCSLPLAYLYYTPLSSFALFVAAGMSASALLWQYTLIAAYRATSVATVQPFEFFKLLFAALLGYLFFTEIPAPRVYAGGALIVGSAVYITYRERVKRGEKGSAA